ncbi:uncharacterized protein PFL1_05686 [Pseudozyma flocculosa PF-1]|uniref:Glycosyl transferase CAP10 domain-containing protein n=2 Tax=Pseudozyma flocculosa TaxID=84751 RepID=A0A5C3F973_9BASI|nr:uncharacterized protein PFL1_05686 [Pseudozyma flocculosa PF-1]EPQ26707.1 hypothetical protein PFL1_05686 [Pseudozyma flocculosa PF-1]SPO40972.1 uncharacterized protein PSFLO_06454 [Pseudozyma flocculosa]
MVGLFSRYQRVPASELPSNTAEAHRPSSHGSTSAKPGFGRARTRWALIIAAIFALLLFLGLNADPDPTSGVDSWRAKAGQYADRLGSGGWSWKPSPPKPAEAPETEAPIQVIGKEMQRWTQGSGRANLTYNSPFNPEDLTLTEEECDAFFPGLWDEIDRSVKHFTHVDTNSRQYLDKVCDDGIWSHARVLVHNNKVYLRYFQKSPFTRLQAALALLYQSVITSREKLPDVEFCISLNDWGSQGKFSLDRAPYLHDVWLMPDYGWYAWPEHVGSYAEYREKTLQVERDNPWEKKISKLFWRGSMGVGTADREAMLGAAEGHEWNDAKAMTWGKGGNIPMEDHCKWKFHGFPEGVTYSGRLRYLQNCKVVIVTHEPRWIQHWTHLYNPDPNSPDQNIVFVPKYDGDQPGILTHNEKGEASYDKTWMRLPETMDDLLRNDDKARRIAENQWTFFRERYISPASAACYWRKLIKGYATTQLFTPVYHGNETSYEGFQLQQKLRTDP